MKHTGGATSGKGATYNPEYMISSSLRVGFMLYNLQSSVQCFVSHCCSLFYVFWSLYLLRFTASGYSFGIFKPFLPVPALCINILTDRILEHVNISFDKRIFCTNWKRQQFYTPPPSLSLQLTYMIVLLGCALLIWK